MGRILLTKMESLSQFLYRAYSLTIPPKTIKIIDQLNFNFIWRNKTLYIRKGEVLKSYDEGGLNAIDFDSMNGTLKLKWLQSFISCGRAFWFKIPSTIF